MNPLIRRSSRAARAFYIGAVASTVSLVIATTASAQTSPNLESFGNADTPRASGSTLLRTSLIGALSGTVLAMGYYFMSEKGERSSGCQPLDCAMPFLTGSGAIAGLFIGRELDAQRKAFAPRAGTSIDFNFAEGSTLAPPTYIDVRDSLVAVVSDSGAQLFSATPSPKALRRRANGLSALRQVVLVPSRHAIVLGTGSALWEVNQITGPASRIADGPVDALAASPSGALLSAQGQLIRLRSGNGEMATTDSMTMPLAVTAVAYDSVASAWWVSTDSAMVQVTDANGKLTATAIRLGLPASARAIATNGTWIAAALGDEGIVAWRRAGLGSGNNEAVRVINEPRFAYDLAFLGEALYVAGGVDGLFHLSLAPTPLVVGSSRQLQFATTVRAGNGVLWVGDRNRQAIVRIVPE